MATSSPDQSQIVVTGANGLVGSRVCAQLVGAGATVRAIVRRSGTAPQLAGVDEVVGDFGDPSLAKAVVHGASAVVTTVHPMGSDLETQHRVAVEGTPVLARAARDARVARLIHISTASVYARSPQVGAVDESSPLVADGDGDGDYAATKRDTDLALAGVHGITTMLVRPPVILGASSQSMWNSLRPAAIRDHEAARHAVANQTFAWVHVNDLSSLVVDLTLGRIMTSDDPSKGPLEGGCTAVNVAGGAYATVRDYHQRVCDAVGVEPVWEDTPAWTGHYLADRARSWGWSPSVDLADALAELEQGLRG